MKSKDLDKQELEIVVNEWIKIYHKYYDTLEEFLKYQVRRCDECGKVEIVDAEDELPTLTFKNIINGEKTILLKPVTYMNLSGESVIKVMTFYKIDPSDILVITSLTSK